MQSTGTAWVGGWGFIQGLGPVDLKDASRPLPESVEDQARQIVSNLEVILKQKGGSLLQIVSVRIHLIEFKALHERLMTVWNEIFPSPTFAQSCIGVHALTRGAQVEMDFIVRESQ